MGYLVCTFVFLNQQTQLCPGDGDIYAMGPHRRTEEWQRRLQIVQGAVLMTCLTQILIGLIGNIYPSNNKKYEWILPLMISISLLPDMQTVIPIRKVT